MLRSGIGAIKASKGLLTPYDVPEIRLEVCATLEGGVLHFQKHKLTSERDFSRNQIA